MALSAAPGHQILWVVRGGQVPALGECFIGLFCGEVYTRFCFFFSPAPDVNAQNERCPKNAYLHTYLEVHILRSTYIDTTTLFEEHGLHIPGMNETK